MLLCLAHIVPGLLGQNLRNKLLGVFFSAEGPQGKNTFSKMIQNLAEATFNLGSAPRDEVALATVQDAEAQ
jgi:hypothetical protein